MIFSPLPIIKALSLSLICLLCAACNLQQVAGQTPAPMRVSRHLYIVAHQDDDLLFMTPDLQHDIDNQVQLMTVFLTAGDANFTRLPSDREQGILDAYATMVYGLNGPDVASWVCGYAPAGDRKIWQCSLDREQNISLVFIRLRDWAPELTSLWDGSTEEARIVHADREAFTGETYSRQELVATLAALIDEFAPDRLGTLDPNPQVYGSDHPEHIAVSRFALAAHHTAPGEREVLFFRTYNIRQQQANLTADEQTRAWQALLAYCRASGERCSPLFADYTWRRYASKLLWSADPVRLRDHHGRCLGINGTRLYLRSCQNTPSEQWLIGAEGEIASGSGQCLSYSQVTKSSLFLDSCTKSGWQQWQAWSNGQIRSALGGCLATATAGDEVKLVACRGENGEPVPEQRWDYSFLSESGPLPLVP